MYVGNVGAAFAAYLAGKGPSVSKTTKAREVDAEAGAESETVVKVEMTADAGLTEGRAKLTARDAQAELAAQALNIANSQKNTKIKSLVG